MVDHLIRGVKQIWSQSFYNEKEVAMNMGIKVKLMAKQLREYPNENLN